MKERRRDLPNWKQIKPRAKKKTISWPSNQGCAQKDICVLIGSERALVFLTEWNDEKERRSNLDASLIKFNPSNKKVVHKKRQVWSTLKIEFGKKPSWNIKTNKEREWNGMANEWRENEMPIPRGGALKKAKKRITNYYFSTNVFRSRLIIPTTDWHHTDANEKKKTFNYRGVDRELKPVPFEL